MGDLAGKKLGILLASHPDRGDLAAVAHLAESARGAGVDTYLYMIDEGTRHYHDPVVARLRQGGVKLYVCAYGGKPRGVLPDAGAVFGGLSALGGIMEACDRFVAFT